MANFTRQIAGIKRESQLEEIVYKQFFKIAQKALVEIYSAGLIQTH
jgi:hypothetical protein